MSNSSSRKMTTAYYKYQKEDDESQTSDPSLGNEDPPGGPSSPSEAESPNKQLVNRHEGSGEEIVVSLTPLENVGTRTGGIPLPRGTLRKTHTGLPRDRPLLSKLKVEIPIKKKHRQQSHRKKSSYEEREKGKHNEHNPSKRRKTDESGSSRKKSKCRNCSSRRKMANGNTGYRATLPVKREIVSSDPSSSDSEVELLCQEDKKPVFRLDSNHRSDETLNGSVVVLDPPPNDSIDHFGKYVTSLLRRVSKKRSLRLQKEVISLVLEDQMKSSDDSD